jgi:cytochrome P450
MSATSSVDSFLNPRTLVCPFDYYKRLRADEPMFFQPDLQMWVFTRYEDVRAIFSDADTFGNYVPYDELAGDHSLSKLHLDYVAENGWEHVPTLQQSDGEDHTRYRRAVSDVFKPSWVRSLAPQIEQIADEVIDSFIGQGECEFVEAFAVQMPGRVIATQVGLPAEQVTLFRRWADALLAPADGRVVDAESAQYYAGIEVEAQHYLAEVFEQRRREPRDDLISRLVNAPDDGQPMTAHELQHLMWQMITGGFETTTDAFSMGMWLLCKHPDALRRIRDDRSLVGNFIEEVLRLGPPAAGMFRRAMRDVELYGNTIRAGQVVHVRIGSANRDETMFSDAESFDLDRPATPAHMSFGKGRHFCIGAPLARLELRIGFNRLLDRLDDVELIDDGPEPERRPSFIFYSIKNLRIRFTAQSAEGPR